MDYQIAIYSADVIFSRMIELEFIMLGRSVFRSEHTSEHISADVVILDLDTAIPPPPSRYRRMIGFTGSSMLLSDEVRRSCSMILHRPFEMRLLRREVLEEADQRSAPTPAFAAPSKPTAADFLLDPEKQAVFINRIQVPLSPNELRVLQLLLSQKGKCVSRAEISAAIGDSSANKADVYICYLRRKLERFTGLRIIKTIHKQGYTIQ